MSQEKQTISFHLVSITTEEFATFREHCDLGNPNFEIALQVGMKAKAESNLIGVFTRITFSQGGQVVLVLLSACHFQIQKDFWEAQLSGGKLALPVDFATHLLVIAIGTARGIIHAKKPGWLEHLVLGTLDVSEVFQGETQVAVEV